MNKQRDEGTKTRVLEEACKVFAEKGYRDATHAEICRRACTNAAAINYYFTSKENLYRTAFKHLMQKVERLYPLDGGLPADSSPERRLFTFIHAHLRRMFDPELLGDLHRIRMAEIFDSTGLLENLLEEQLARDREHVQKSLRELLGPDTTQRAIDWCEMSIVGQCFIGPPGPSDKGPRKIFGFKASEVHLLAEHIFRFSLAGVEAIRRHAGGGTDPVPWVDEYNATGWDRHHDTQSF